MRVKDKKKREEILKRIAEGEFKDLNAEEKKLFVTTHEIAPSWHVKIQAAWQKYFDNSISKTINFGHEATVKEVKEAYMQAWKMGCKGITIYRDGSKDDQVLSAGKVSGKKVVEARQSGEQQLDLTVCPECGGKLEKQEGCSKCYDCGYSVCG